MKRIEIIRDGSKYYLVTPKGVETFDYNWVVCGLPADLDIAARSALDPDGEIPE